MLYTFSIECDSSNAITAGVTNELMLLTRLLSPLIVWQTKP